MWTEKKSAVGCGFPGVRLGRICIGGCHCLKRTPSTSLFAALFPLDQATSPKTADKDENCPERETEQQAISSLQAGQASHPMQPEACCIDYVVDRPRYSMYVHHYRCITLDWGLSRIYPSHNALFSMDVFPLRGGMGVCLR